MRAACLRASAAETCGRVYVNCHIQIFIMRTTMRAHCAPVTVIITTDNNNTPNPVSVSVVYVLSHTPKNEPNRIWYAKKTHANTS